MKRGIVGWLWRRRDSARAALIFRVLTMGLGMLLSLYWIRVLAGVLGAELYGLFMSFMAVTRLCSLGEAGLGGALVLHAIPLIAQHREEELMRLVTAGRTLLVSLAVLFAGIALCLSPWLPSWLGFQPLPGAGSLAVLFALGAVLGGVTILGNYTSSLSYALGCVAWPVLPAFVTLQLAMATQTLLAKAGNPLWIQYLPHLASGFATVWIAWLPVRWTNPALSVVRPLQIDKAMFRLLLSSGLWAYLCGLGNLLFTTTSQLVINAGFGPELVAPFVFNYKIPELAYAIIAAAGLVAFPKIARLMNSSNDGERATGHQLFTHLHRLQLWSGMCIALVYVFLNDRFIQLWLGNDYRVSVYLQLAFAANLVFAAAGEAAQRRIVMFSATTLPFYGRVVLAMGVLNLALSLCSMRFGSLIGIGAATALAQLGLNCSVTIYLARHKDSRAGALLGRTLIHAGIFVLLLAGLKLFWPAETIWGRTTLVLAALSLLTFEFWLLGLRPHQLAAEYRHLRVLLKADFRENTPARD